MKFFKKLTQIDWEGTETGCVLDAGTAKILGAIFVLAILPMAIVSSETSTFLSKSLWILLISLLTVLRLAVYRGEQAK